MCNVDADIHIVSSAAVPVAGVHERERGEIFCFDQQKMRRNVNVSGDYERNVNR